MAGFFENLPQFQAPPTDLPTADVPPSNFVQASKEVAEGVKQSGFWDGLFQSALYWVTEILGAVVGFLLKILNEVALFVVSVILKEQNQTSPQVQEAMKLAIGDTFGVNVPGGVFQSISDAGQRGPLAKSVGEAVLKSISGELTPSAEAGIAPGTSRAEAWLTNMVGMGMESWLQQFTFEIFSLGQLNSGGELKDKLVADLGLGRISRQVLRPVVSAYIEEPFTQKLNLSHRPKLLSPAQAVKQFTRGVWTREQLDFELGKQGWSAGRIEAMINDHTIRLSVGDVHTLINSQSMTQEQGEQYLRDNGYDAITAARALASDEVTQVRPLYRQVVNEWMNAFVDGITTQSEFYAVVDSTPLPANEKEIVKTLALSKRQFRVKQISSSQMANIVREGLATIQDYRNTLLSEGYSLSDAKTLELYLLLQMKEDSDARSAREAREREAEVKKAEREAAAAAKRAAEVARLAFKGVSATKFEAMVRAGLRSLPEYRAFLVAQGVTADNADDIVALLAANIEGRRVLAAQREANAAAANVRGVNLGQLDRAVRAGIITAQEYVAKLRELNFDEQSIALMVDLVESDLDDALARQEAHDAAEAAAKVKGISLSQFERAVRLGLRSVAEYGTWLRSNGYGADDVAILSDTLTRLIADDEAAAALREEANAKSEQRGLSLADTERAVRAGVLQPSAYEAALLALDYDADARETLLALLALKMQQDQQTLALEGHAGALLAERGLSLDDVQRGVELGIVKPEVYVATLRESGFTKDDADYLGLVEAGRRAARSQAMARTETAAAKLSAAGVSLASLQSSVRAGRLTLADFAAQLARAGVDEGQSANLVALLRTELDAIQAAAATRAAAANRPKVKDLTLSQVERAVKSGEIGLAEYANFARSMGYAEADVQLLAGTLAAQLETGEEAA
jgi:hypothetical protein